MSADALQPTSRFVAAVLCYFLRERQEIREFRSRRINHAVAEAAYDVPVRPARPRTVVIDE